MWARPCRGRRARKGQGERAVLGLADQKLEPVPQALVLNDGEAGRGT